MHADPQLEIIDLQLSQHAKPLLTLNVNLAAGEILTIMGPSGSGKSTVLNWIAGLLPAEFSAQGSLKLCGEHITHLPAYQRQIGLLLQDALLFPHLTVAENIAFAMPKAVRGKEREEQIETALAKVGLAGLGKRDPQGLSGGQQARVALLRVMLAKPKALLLDEPFSKLDSQLRQEVRQLVLEYIAKAKIPAILVTHDAADIPPNGKLITLATPTEQQQDF